MRGSGSFWCGITPCNIGRSPTRAWRIGSSICRPPGSGPCAVGSVSVRLPANRSTRKVGIDARVSVEGVPYEVAPDLAGETVTLWWGLFDEDLYVEHGDQRYGPYAPVGGPIPLHRYRRFKKTATQKRADRIEDLAAQLTPPTGGGGGGIPGAGLRRREPPTGGATFC